MSPESSLNCSSAEVIYNNDRDYIPYSHQYLVATSTKRRARWFPPKATQSPKTMPIWKFWGTVVDFWFFFPLVGFLIVAKELILDGRIHELTILALVSAVRCFWLRNFLQPKMQWRLRDLNCVLFSHGASVNEGGIGGRLVASLWTILRVRMGIGSTAFLWRVVTLGSLGGTLVGCWGRRLMSIEGRIEGLEDRDFSSDVMMCGDWGFWAGVIFDGRTEGLSMVVYLVDIGSMYSLGPWCDVPRGPYLEMLSYESYT